MSREKKLLPFRQYTENDVINQFSLTEVCDAGTFVAIKSGDMDNQEGMLTTTPGAPVKDAYSFNWGTKTKLRFTTATDTKYTVLGITLRNRFDVDENGIPYKFYKQKAIDNFVNGPDEAMPVLTRGVVQITSEAYIGTPQVGYVLTPAADGKVNIVDPTTVTDAETIIGKVIGYGAKFGGFAMVLLYS